MHALHLPKGPHRVWFGIIVASHRPQRSEKFHDLDFVVFLCQRTKPKLSQFSHRELSAVPSSRRPAPRLFLIQPCQAAAKLGLVHDPIRLRVPWLALMSYLLPRPCWAQPQFVCQISSRQVPVLAVRAVRGVKVAPARFLVFFSLLPRRPPQMRLIGLFCSQTTKRWPPLISPSSTPAPLE